MSMADHREALSEAVDKANRDARNRLRQVRDEADEELSKMSSSHRAARRAWEAKPSPVKVKPEPPAPSASTTTIVTQAAAVQPPALAPRGPHYQHFGVPHYPAQRPNYQYMGYPPNPYAVNRPPYG